jgi:hypothetical protein
MTEQELFHLTYEQTPMAAAEVATGRNLDLGRDVFYARQAPGRYPQGYPWEVVGRRLTAADCGCVYDEEAMWTETWCEEHGTPELAPDEHLEAVYEDRFDAGEAS